MMPFISRKRLAEVLDRRWKCAKQAAGEYERRGKRDEAASWESVAFELEEIRRELTP